MKLTSDLAEQQVGDVAEGQGQSDCPDDDLYQVKVTEVVEATATSDSHVVTLEVMKGVMTGTTFEKDTFKEFFKDHTSPKCNKPKYALERICLLLIGTKTATMEEIRNDADVDLMDCVGKTMLVLTRQSESKGRMFCNIDFKNLYQVDDPRVPELIEKLKKKKEKSAKSDTLSAL